jgi:hypothetical protein
LNEETEERDLKQVPVTTSNVFSAFASSARFRCVALFNPRFRFALLTAAPNMEHMSKKNVKPSSTDFWFYSVN